MLIKLFALYTFVAYSSEFSVHENHKFYNFKLNTDVMSLDSTNIDLSLKIKKCNQVIFKKLKKRVENSLQNLNANNEKSSLFINFQNKVFYLRPKNDFDRFLLELVKEFQVAKIQENLNC